MKTQSAKAKGRKLQQWVRDQIIEQLEVHPEDIESRSMGAGGEDSKLYKIWKFLIQFITPALVGVTILNKIFQLGGVTHNPKYPQLEKCVE